MFIISRCLLGFDCKYDGGSNRNEELIEFCRTHDYVTVCPETAAGLTSPREPAEINMDTVAEDGSLVRKVISRDGIDLTEVFDYGARLSLESVLVEAGSRNDGSGIIEGAILKANSPSCGTGSVYDGTFTGTLTGGLGIFADKLIDACLEERNDPYKSEENKVFAPDFRVCDEYNFARVFGDK
jgi:uncharacterized protein YbbK (DUF523 family)